MKKFFPILARVLFAVTLLVSGPAGAQEVKELEVPAIMDFSGPYADLMKFVMPVRDAVGLWWNETQGKDLGIKLVFKNYDCRYDPTVVASTWPGILANKPVIVAGLGGADVAALQQRLPNDKVPVTYSTASYGYAWKPDQWIFQPRPTYVHEYAAALNWIIKQNPDKRPLRVATMGFQGAAALLDIIKGMQVYIKTNLEPNGQAKLVSEQWIDFRPVDVSSQYRAIMEAKADLVIGIANTGQAGAYLKAAKMMGKSIPTLASPHHTIWPLSIAMKSFAPWEGHYVAAAAASSSEKTGTGYEFFQTLKKYNPKLNDNLHWSPFGILGISGGLLLVRGVEHAAKEVGAENLTGQAVYDAFLKKPMPASEFMGILPGQHFTKQAPFPTKDLQVKITTVKNGKYTLAAPDWIPVPGDVKKW